VTDANVVLGRIVPRYFPQIFGATEDQPLDVAASKNAFQDLTNEVFIWLHFFQIETFSYLIVLPATNVSEGVDSTML